MAELNKLPRRLYKYRSFSHYLLDMLVRDELYYSNPSEFNDPLDCRPTLDADISNDQLEQVLSNLCKRRFSDEMKAAAKSFKYPIQEASEHIARHSQQDAAQLLDGISYLADDSADHLQSLLRQSIEDELLRRYDRGIVSLGVRATCPLMWSHYGDQHNGICVGYSVPAGPKVNLHKIRYGGSRMVLASDVAIMESDSAAQQRVDEAVLLRKAKSWSYEREWRLIGKRDAQPSPLELEEVIFGIRCKLSVKFTVVQALANRSRPVRFFEIREVPGTFDLRKDALDTDELRASFPRRSRAAFDYFYSHDKN